MKILLLLLLPLSTFAITINDNLEVISDSGENWGKYNDALLNRKSFATEIKAALDTKAINVNKDNPELAKAIVNAVPASYISDASKSKVDADLATAAKAQKDLVAKRAVKQAIDELRGSPDLQYLFDKYSDHWEVISLAISDYIWSIVDKDPLKAQSYAHKAQDKGIALSDALFNEIERMVAQLPQ